jgi:hypothetical protein
VIGDAVVGWRLLWFVALRHLTPVGKVLLTTGLVASLALPFHLAPARTYTMTVTVRGLADADPLPIAAIEVTAGRCLVAAATASHANDAAFVLPAGNYAVTARTNADGQVAGWAMDVVVLRLDRDLAVAIDHALAPESDLFSMRTAPPAPCPGR